MQYFPPALEQLVEQFAKLPGVGRKSAQRLAFHVLSLSEEETSAFATVGLSVGISGAAGPLSKIVLILNMFLGRVGLLSLALALAMKSGGKKEVLPSGRILIG